jgi:hypothetical protein
MLGLRTLCVLLSLSAACSSEAGERAATGQGRDAAVQPEPAARADAGSPRADAARPDTGIPRDASTEPQPDASDGLTEPPPLTDDELGGDPGSALGEPEDEASHVFDQSALRTYNLVIEPADLAKLDRDPAAEEYVPAMLEVEGKRYGPLGVRYKGSIGAFLYPCTDARQVGDTPGPKTGKCSIKVDFNHVDDDARFYGLKALNFHSMNQDPSQLRDRLGYAMFREMGIASPRAVHARVTINGVLEGLFIAVEQIDGRFARSRFSEGGKGNVYKEVWPIHEEASVYQEALETNEEVGNVAKMVAFKHAVDEGTTSVEGWLDRDYMARYLAVDRLIINDDGALHWYCLPDIGPSAIWNHNFYWYEPPHAKRMWLVPWDLDNSFLSNTWVHIAPRWSEQAECSCTGTPEQRPPSCDPLTRDLAGWDADYEAAVAAFVSGPFSAASVNAKLDTWSEQIEAATLEASGLRGAPVSFVWQLSVGGLRAIIDESREDHGYAY